MVNKAAETDGWFAKFKVRVFNRSWRLWMGMIEYVEMDRRL